ncbi:MAG: NADH-ubiquinone oxidoreductase-F iron-sulfur binding region domain-containing protein [Rhodoferax sp.]
MPPPPPSAARSQGRSRHPGHTRGHTVQPQALAELRALVGEGDLRRDWLIEYLHRLQDHFGGLFHRHLVALAHAMRLGVVEVYEVASFYHHFDVLADDQAPARLTVRVCQSQSCAMAGSGILLRALQAEGALPAGVRVLAAPCVGRCAQAPVAVVHQTPVPQADATAVFEASNKALARVDCGYCATDLIANEAQPVAMGLDDYLLHGGYQLAAALVQGEEDPELVLSVLEDAGLRGLGGAGFGAARKWRIVRGQPGPRALVVNIDEGEPGTFKDRHFLERDPHRFMEGVLIAAQVVGTERVVLYLRDEYHQCRALLQRVLAQLQECPPCPLPEIELRRGAGAYVCGEESALVESVEGKRGEPRLRPPYLAQKGLWGMPTLEHNFETLYWVRELVERGGAWFRAQGRHGRTGLRAFSVSGRVREPGVKLAPAGITVRELIAEYCGGMPSGHELYAYMPGGASGGILPARLADVPLDFDTLQPHGGFIGSAAVVVLSQHDAARDAALNAMEFFAAESCGQCTPCRVGTAQAAQLMRAPVWDMDTLADLAQVMEDASICGLGQAAPNALRCVQRYFAHEIGAVGVGEGI